MNGLSIVIPAYNEEKYLPATIAALDEAIAVLKRGVPEFATEIVVVNNVSTDRTVEVARDLGARVIDHDVRSIAAVRNAGIRAAKYDLVFTIDADCALQANGLLEIYKTMSTGACAGGSVNLRILSDKFVPRAAAFVVQTLVVAIAGINGAIFFFLKADALSFGGFSEDRLIAEDSVFAMDLRRHGKSQGKTFTFLKHVTVTTTDRKETTVAALLPLARHAWRAFHGKAVDRKHLGYWYDPKR